MNRVSPGTMTVVVFAILVGLGGAYVVRQQMNGPQLPPLSDIQLKGGEKKIIVPVAAIDLEKGRELSLHDVVIHSFTPEQYAKSKFAGQPYIRHTSQIFGRVLNQEVVKGTLFLPDLFYPDGHGPGVAERLQAGFRAVTVPIEDVGAVTGFAQPGSIVDVLFRSAPEGERPEVTMTLLEQVEVLALAETVTSGQRVDIRSQGNVTLAVTPAQAKILKVVEGRGELSLSLRNPDDFGNFEFAPVNLDSQVNATAPSQFQTVNFSNANSSTSSTSSSSSSSSSNSGADLFGSMNLVLDDASERVTLDDLLGMEANPEKKQLHLYIGGSRQVIEFDGTPEEEAQPLRHGNRVQTPIAGRPPMQKSKTKNVSLDYLP